MPVSTPASAEIGYLHPIVALQHFDRDLDDAELHELESFLDSPGLADTAMDLYGIDGYFAAILSGPRTLMPSEWMPSIWGPNGGDASPEFENLEHANRILGLLMRHYNTVVRVLMDEPELPTELASSLACAELAENGRVDDKRAPGGARPGCRRRVGVRLMGSSACEADGTTPRLRAMG